MSFWAPIPIPHFGPLGSCLHESGPDVGSICILGELEPSQRDPGHPNKVSWAPIVPSSLLDGIASDEPHVSELAQLWFVGSVVL